MSKPSFTTLVFLQPKEQKKKKHKTDESKQTDDDCSKNHTSFRWTAIQDLSDQLMILACWCRG